MPVVPRRLIANTKPAPPGFTPASSSATDSERMIRALEFIAERMASIESRLAHLEEIAQQQ